MGSPESASAELSHTEVDKDYCLTYDSSHITARARNNDTSAKLALEV